MRILLVYMGIVSQLWLSACSGYHGTGLSDLEQTGGRNAVGTEFKDVVFPGLAYLGSPSSRCNVALFYLNAAKFYLATPVHCLEDRESRTELTVHLRMPGISGTIEDQEQTFLVRYERERRDETYDLVIYSLADVTSLSATLKKMFIPTEEIKLNADENSEVSFADKTRSRISMRLVEYNAFGELSGQRFTTAPEMFRRNADLSHVFRVDPGSSGAVILSCKREGRENFYADCALICIHQSIDLDGLGVCTAPHLFLKEEL